MHFSNYSSMPLASSLAEKAGERPAIADSLRCIEAEHCVDAERAIASLLSQFSAADFDPDKVAFPDEIGGVYTDLAIAEYRLRVYAMVHSPQTSLSSLFLILGALQGSYLPIGSRLSVRENNLLLSEQAMHWNQHSTYLYTQVFGSWAEKFTIEILLPNARPKVLAPLALRQARSLRPLIEQMAA